MGGVRLISSASKTWVKMGPFFEGKVAGVEVKDVSAQDVRRQDVGGELNAAKVGLNELG